MKGIYLDDPQVISALDSSETKSSIIYEENSKLSRFEIGEFQDLLHYVEYLVEESLVKIIGGDIAISPYMMGNATACDYCEYKSICQFDDSLGHCAYRILKKTISKNELLEKAREVNTDEVDG